MTTKKLGDLFPKASNAVDPVCHMDVSTVNPRGGTAMYDGKTYYFCSQGCNKSFTTDPVKYLSGKGPVGMPHM